MKLFIYSRRRTHISAGILEWCMEAPGKFGYEWALNDECADAIEEKYQVRIGAENRYSVITPEDVGDDVCMVSVGGDGTFLEAVHTLRGLPIPIVGVNTGRLGFLAQIMPEELDGTFGDIFAGRRTVERRTMLTVEGDFGAAAPGFPCALNEFTLHRHTADMVEIACWIDGCQLPNARGDGTIVSTPTGSTAYSLSAGGPIVTPECQCFVVTGIAQHNVSLRPLVVPDTSTITLEVRTRGREVMASLDNRPFIVGDGARFTIKKSEFSVFLMQVQNISFYDTLRDRIMWGVDRRDSI